MDQNDRRRGLGIETARVRVQFELRATSENVRATFGKLAASMQSTDVLFVMLIGHGTADTASAKFNLVGPDLGVEDWKTVLAPIKARILLMVALTQTQDIDELRRIFAQY